MEGERQKSYCEEGVEKRALKSTSNVEQTERRRLESRQSLEEASSSSSGLSQGGRELSKDDSKACNDNMFSEFQVLNFRVSG